MDNKTATCTAEELSATIEELREGGWTICDVTREGDMEHPESLVYTVNGER